MQWTRARRAATPRGRLRPLQSRALRRCGAGRGAVTGPDRRARQPAPRTVVATPAFATRRPRGRGTPTRFPPRTGGDTRAHGLAWIIRASTAASRILDRIWYALATVAGARRVLSSATHAWTSTCSMAPMGWRPKAGNTCVRRYELSRARVDGRRFTVVV